MNVLWNWNTLLSQGAQVDKSVQSAQIGDLIEFVLPWSGLSLWAVYVGEGHVMHFGVGDENTTQKACRSMMQLLMPKSKSGRMLKKTRICTQLISEIKVPAGTSIRINNHKHRLVPSPLDEVLHRCHTFHHQEFKYDIIKFNSEHFATFVRYGQALCNQISFKNKDNQANADTTQTLQMIMQQRTETES